VVPEKPPKESVPIEERDLFAICIGDKVYLGNLFEAQDSIMPDKVRLLDCRVVDKEGRFEGRLVDLDSTHGMIESNIRAAKRFLSEVISRDVAMHKTNAPLLLAQFGEPHQIDEAIDRASRVLGNRDEAMRWLGTPVRGLGFATPISLLGTKEGAERVSDILGQMEHGVW
jgi:hypothetical protein